MTICAIRRVFCRRRIAVGAVGVGTRANFGMQIRRLNVRHEVSRRDRAARRLKAWRHSFGGDSALVYARRQRRRCVGSGGGSDGGGKWRRVAERRVRRC